MLKEYKSKLKEKHNYHNDKINTINILFQVFLLKLKIEKEKNFKFEDNLEFKDLFKPFWI